MQQKIQKDKKGSVIMFEFDDDFGLDDLIEADIQYGLFEDDDKLVMQQIKSQQKQKKKKKSFWDIFKPYS